MVEGDPIPPSKFVVIKGAIPIATTLPTSAVDAQNDDEKDEEDKQHNLNGNLFTFSPEVCFAHRQELQKIIYKSSARKLAAPATIASIIAGINSRIKFVAMFNDDNQSLEEVPEVVLDARYWKNLIEALCIRSSPPTTASVKSKNNSGSDSGDDSDLDDFLKDLESDDEDEVSNSGGGGDDKKKDTYINTPPASSSSTTTLSPEIIRKKCIIIRDISITRIAIANKPPQAAAVARDDENTGKQQHRGAVNVEYRLTMEFDSEMDAIALLQHTQGFLPYLGPAAVGAPLDFFSGSSDLLTPPVSAHHPSPSASTSTQLPQLKRMFEEVTVSESNETLTRFAPQSEITATNAAGYSFKNFVAFTHAPELAGIVGGSGGLSIAGGAGNSIIVKRPSLLPPSAQSLVSDPSRSEALRSLMMLLYKRGDEHKDLLPDEQAFYDSNAASVFMMSSSMPSTATNDDEKVPQQQEVSSEKQSSSCSSRMLPPDAVKVGGASTGGGGIPAAPSPLTLAEKKAALFARIQEKRDAAAASSSAVSDDTTTTKQEAPGGSSIIVPTPQAQVDTPAVVVVAAVPAFSPMDLLTHTQATHMVMGMPAPPSFPRM